MLSRLGQALLTLFLVSVLLFAATAALPGDAASTALGLDATPDTLAAMRASMGLIGSAPARYWHWLASLLQGDAGISMLTHESVWAGIAGRLVNTLCLAGLAAAIATPIAIALGIYSATKPGSWADRAIGTVCLAASSLPNFVVAYLLVLFLAVRHPWLPSLATVPPGAHLPSPLSALVLPVVVLGLDVVVYIMRMTRAAVLSVLSQPYIDMARLKGVPPWRLVLRHALPNALGPIIQIVATNLAYLLVGVIPVEAVFVYPGIGQYLVDAVSTRDVNVVQACGLVFASAYIGVNMLADLASVLANPRLRHPR